MSTLGRRVVAFFVLALLPLAGTAALAAGCELVVNLEPQLDGAVDAPLDCGICADVSVDADYDAADVSIFGLPPRDAGPDADIKDARPTKHD